MDKQVTVDEERLWNLLFKHVERHGWEPFLNATGIEMGEVTLWKEEQVTLLPTFGAICLYLKVPMEQFFHLPPSEPTHWRIKIQHECSVRLANCLYDHREYMDLSLDEETTIQELNKQLEGINIEKFARCRGVGAKLLQELKDYLKENNISYEK